MAERKDTSRRSPSPQKRQAPSRRNDVIRCENCGEDYSVTYKRCPFCDERPGRRMANNTRGGGYGGPVNPIQVAGLVISLILIIAALFIVFRFVGPLFSGGEDSASSSSSMGSSQGSVSSSGGASSQPQPGGSSSAGGASSQPPTQPPVTVQAISLNRTDFTLTPGEPFPLIAAVSPEGVTEPIVWTSSNTSLATVDETGLVTNVNQGSTKQTATITATCGGVSVTCLVRCEPANPQPTEPDSGDEPGGDGPDTAALGNGDIGVIVNAENGLNVRSGPGTEYSKVASAANGARVLILEFTDNGWYKIEYISGRTGYVLGDYVAAAD